MTFESNRTAQDVRHTAAGPLLAVRDLTVTFPTSRGPAQAVGGISYDIHPHKTLGVVGESGCGKSMTSLAVMGLVPTPGKVGGEILFEGRDLMRQSEEEWRTMRGNRMAMIFQEPMTALNPVIRAGEQIAEGLILHQGLDRKAAAERAVELLDQVGIPSPRERAENFPHQLSGGMRQRVMIAMALACRPSLLIADEPTTALDVTIQAQILELMLELQDQMGMAIQFISHNLGVISELADDIIVMYAGKIVERAPAAALFANPKHPYTQGLIATIPDIAKRQDKLPVIKGGVPDITAKRKGCAFADRCPMAGADCREIEPMLKAVGSGHEAACLKV